MTHSKEEIKRALSKVSEIVYQGGNQKDIAYFNFHKDRYLRMANTLNSLKTDGNCVLNIGSHYLHSSLFLEFLGYDVYSMDVTEFWELDFVKDREKEFNVKRVVENNLEMLSSQDSITDQYDIVLFTEIMEHITYNPILFWKKIYKTMRPYSLIYISTPNSLSLTNIVRSLTRIIAFRGIGTPLNEIFRNVTYGASLERIFSIRDQKIFLKNVRRL